MTHRVSVSKRKCLVVSCTEGPPFLRTARPYSARHCAVQPSSRIPTASSISASSAKPRRSAKSSRFGAVCWLPFRLHSAVPRVQVSKNKATIQSLLSGLKSQPRFSKMAEYSIDCLSGCVLLRDPSTARHPALVYQQRTDIWHRYCPLACCAPSQAGRGRSQHRGAHRRGCRCVSLGSCFAAQHCGLTRVCAVCVQLSSSCRCCS